MKQIIITFDEIVRYRAKVWVNNDYPEDVNGVVATEDGGDVDWFDTVQEQFESYDRECFAAVSSRDVVEVERIVVGKG